MDVFAWVDEQRDRNRQEFYRLLDRGRQIWTPNNIFSQCCVKWLVDGPERIDEYGYIDEYSPRNGCTRCNRAHPCVTLRFDDYTKATTAILSHPLDPFVRYFQGLVEEGKASSRSLSVYQINDYLRPIEAALYAHNGFGNHLVKVEQRSREASDAAQLANLEEGERDSKRPRLKGSGDDDVTTAAGSPDLEKVMDIVFQHELVQDLQNDPVTLYCMRPVCKLFKKHAMRLANKKMKTLDFSITPLVNGTGQYGDDRLDGYDTETFDSDHGLDVDTPTYKYEKKEKVHFAYSERPRGDGGAVEGGHYPVDDAVATFSWTSNELRKDLDEEEDDNHEEAPWADYAYRGQMLRVYWHPKEEDPVKSPERGASFWGEHKPTLGILVREIYMFSIPNVGMVSKSARGGTIKYEVLESNAAERVVDEEADAYDDDGSSENSSNAAPIERRYVKYSGRIKLLEVMVDFDVIVRAHAGKVKRELSVKNGKILKERPLTKTESEYKELISKAAQ